MSVDSESDAEIDVVGDRDPFDEIIDVNEAPDDPAMDTHDHNQDRNTDIVSGSILFFLNFFPLTPGFPLSKSGKNRLRT